MEELYCDLIQENLQNGYIIIYFSRGTYIVKKFILNCPKPSTGPLNWHWWYHYAIWKESVTIFQNTHQDYKGSQNNNYSSYKLTDGIQLQKYFKAGYFSWFPLRINCHSWAELQTEGRAAPRSPKRWPRREGEGAAGASSAVPHGGGERSTGGKEAGRGSLPWTSALSLPGNTEWSATLLSYKPELWQSWHFRALLLLSCFPGVTWWSPEGAVRRGSVHLNWCSHPISRRRNDGNKLLTLFENKQASSTYCEAVIGRMRS